VSVRCGFHFLRLPLDPNTAQTITSTNTAAFIKVRGAKWLAPIMAQPFWLITVIRFP
jgi:hypothetical protein